MRTATLLSMFNRPSRRASAQARTARKSRLAAAERLESRLNFAATLVDLAAARPASSSGHPAYDQLPIPAGATLVDVSDSGRYVLFSSTDTNVIAGQQTIPSINPDLFWLDTATGRTRLVTHRAGSEVQSAGYAGVEGSTYIGPGLGLWAMFQPLTADLSGDGKSVVFDSIINANEYDASVPVQNDQATYRPLLATGQVLTPYQVGTVDVFVWRADGTDAANNISLASRLNDKGQQQAVALAQPGLTPPTAGQPMATGVFYQDFMPISVTNTFSTTLFQSIQSMSLNKGISNDGTRVLYDSFVPAGWIDTVQPEILDAESTQGGQGAGSQWTLDSFVASTKGFGGGGSTGPWSAKTVSVTKEGTAALGYLQTPLFQFATQTTQLFEPLFSQMSGNGKRVVYSTRRTSTDIVNGTTDSDFSSDVFVNDVDSGTNFLVSRKWDDATSAAGSAQPNVFSGGTWTQFSAIGLWDSQNHSISDDGLTIALTSSAGNLVQGFKNVTADLLQPVIAVNTVWTTYPANPIDIYGFRFNSAKTTVSAGKAALVNSPDGLANTNRIAQFGGMSSDGTSFLFGTVANNFYAPGFTSPYPYTQNPPQAPLPLNFILGGFSNLWRRKIDWAAAAKSTTTLVSAGFAVDASGAPDVANPKAKPNASGNQATLESPTPAGARDVLNEISANGRFVMFSSTANNLAEGVYDRNFKGGVFVRDMDTGRTTLLTTTATGNVPSTGVFVNSALATEESKDKTISPRFACFVDGTGANDMQTRFRTEEVAPLPISHVYAIDYPAVSQAASANNPAIFTVAGVGVNTRPVLEFRDPFPPLITPSVKTSPGQLLPGFFGEWRTATGDVNADGVVDYVYGASLGGQDTVIVIDGRTNSVIWQVAGMFPLVAGATGAAARPGVFVATADVNCDGFAEVIVGSAGLRQSQVNIYEGRRGTLFQSFRPFGVGVKTGARVAGGDVDGDGYGDVVVGRGPGGTGRVEVYSGRVLTVAAKSGQAQLPPTALLKAFTVLGSNGVYVAAADMTRDGRAEVVVGFDNAPTVSIYDGLKGTLVSKKDLGAAFKTGGVRVAARAGQVMVASGAGTSPTIQLYAYADKVWTLRSSLANEKISGFTNKNTRGVFVG